ncbi:ATP-binding protein [Actinomyces qiguomingii]|uniref:ATP-binding protein n=1 Tax=Actinomyces qiguomingii TaxID=2057800 RepID=UPI000CA08C7A|nr:ATP-binding protein [Actinomyces qiguomingii]
MPPSSGPPRLCLYAARASFLDDATRQTGSGRFLRMRERAMTWFERGTSTGTLSFGTLIAGGRPAANATASSYHDVVDALAHTGFPALTRLEPAATAVTLSGCQDDFVRTDLGRLARTRRAPTVMRALIRALALATAAEVSSRTLARDLRQVTPDICPETVAHHVELLERLFVVEQIPAWAVGAALTRPPAHRAYVPPGRPRTRRHRIERGRRTTHGRP